ncbi:MAG TPA: N-acetylmuramoyl-L-alanine amidase [Turneriella sp.]|nr:N-acetylmuramoyl-L-alanine amidase [Turneriella sp.]
MGLVHRLVKVKILAIFYPQRGQKITIFTKIILVSLISLLGGALSAEQIRSTLVYIEGEAYLSAGNLKRLHNNLSVHYNRNEKQGEVRFGKRIILFTLDKADYQVQAEKHELDAVGVLDRKGLFFSQEFVEEILTELNLPVSYRFSKTHLFVEATEKRVSAEKLDFIYIDAGHGGKDSGALGYFDVAEKDITLRLARKLYKQLKIDFPQTKVYLTRSRDKFLSLEKRSQLANRQLRKKKDAPSFGLFVSIHCNSHLSPRVKGFEIYYLAQNSRNKNLRELYLRENNRYEKSAYIRRLTSRLMNAQIQRESKNLARSVFLGIGNRLDGMIKSRKVKKADFAVLRGSLMPAILIETGYLTNKDDLKKLRSAAYADAFVVGVSHGIGAFLRELANTEK